MLFSHCQSDSPPLVLPPNSLAFQTQIFLSLVISHDARLFRETIIMGGLMLINIKYLTMQVKLSFALLIAS